MQSDNAIGPFCFGSEFGDWQGRSICRENRGVRCLLSEITKNLLLDFQLFGSCFNRRLDVAHFDRHAGSDNAGAPLFRFFL